MISFTKQREEFIRTCQRAFFVGMQVSTGGNLSCKLQGSLFLVKPSGISLFDLTGEDLLVTDASGKIVEGNGKPTKELKSHLSIYKVRKDIGGIAHYHAPYSTAFAVSGKEIPLKTLHARRILGSIPFIPPEKEGSDALALSLEQTFSNPAIHAALLSGHGIITGGADLTEAQNLAELAEESAKIACLSQLLTASAGQNETRMHER